MGVTSVEREDRQRGHDLAIRFGGSMTGVGIGAGILYVFGSEAAFTAPTSVSLILIGPTLMAIGYRARRTKRH